LAVLFEAKNLSKTYGRQKIQYHDIEIEQGKITVINGKTGVGKTTLLNMLGLMNHIEFDENSDITLKRSLLDETLSDISYKDIQKNKEIENLRKKYFGFMFQQDQLIDTMNGWQNIAMPLLVRQSKLSMKKIKDKIDALLTAHQFDDMRENNLMDRSPATYSGGQRQRTALLRAIIHQPKVLFADEPLASVDEETAINILNVLSQKAKDGMTIILVIHNTHLNLLEENDIKYTQVNLDNHQNEPDLKRKHCYEK